MPLLVRYERGGPAEVTQCPGVRREKATAAKEAKTRPWTFWLGLISTTRFSCNISEGSENKMLRLDPG